MQIWRATRPAKLRTMNNQKACVCKVDYRTKIKSRFHCNAHLARSLLTVLLLLLLLLLPLLLLLHLAPFADERRAAQAVPRPLHRLLLHPQ